MELNAPTLTTKKKNETKIGEGKFVAKMEEMPK